MRRLATACGVVAPALLALGCVALLAFPGEPQPTAGGICFIDLTKASGLDFKQSYGDRHLDNIVEGTGTGVCVFDYNNDGFLDVYFPNGRWTEGVSDPKSRDLRGKLTNHLFRNDGHGKFTDVTEQAGVGGSRYSAGCAAADYDNDGFVDLLVLNYGRNELFHNDGHGRFTEVAAKAGLTNASFSLSAVWYDYNNDGYLDV
ncbi:MAG: VCBS repeat-containing protein, partial [Bryobacteraceae bacterium]